MKKLENFLDSNPNSALNDNQKTRINGSRLAENTAYCFTMESTCVSECADFSYVTYEDGVKTGAYVTQSAYDCP